MERDAHFTVVYQLTADTEDEAHQLAERVRIEQSVEMPLSAVPESAKNSLPEILSVEQAENRLWSATISYPLSLFDGDITQFLNVLFGNISLLDGIKITDVSDNAFAGAFHGPEFGIDGIRKKLNIDKRPISCTALKPVGLSPGELTELAYRFTLGGIDMIKDDHGLANQSSADFRARVSACVQAVRMGEQSTGKKTLYLPNITTSPVHVLDRLHEATELGADGVLISPQLCGIEILHSLSARGHLPVMAHPAFSGPYVIHSAYGFTPELYYGKLWRALGADAIIYPNAGGRFSFKTQTCLDLNDQMRSQLCGFKPSLPTPAGGINLETVPVLLENYGNETIYLIGGNLYEQPAGIETATRDFQQILENYG